MKTKLLKIARKSFAKRYLPCKIRDFDKNGYYGSITLTTNANLKLYVLDKWTDRVEIKKGKRMYFEIGCKELFDPKHKAKKIIEIARVYLKLK